MSWIVNGHSIELKQFCKVALGLLLLKLKFLINIIGLKMEIAKENYPDCQEDDRSASKSIAPPKKEGYISNNKVEQVKIILEQKRKMNASMISRLSALLDPEEIRWGTLTVLFLPKLQLICVGS